MKLTKSVIDKLDLPTKGNQVFYRDDELRGFALRITDKGVKSFIVEKSVKGKVRRITVGRYGILTAEEARKQAHKVLGKIATGIDPIVERHIEKTKALTLKEVLQAYLQARKSLKKATSRSYEKIINTSFADWTDKPLTSITKDNVATKHTQLGENSGQAQANLAMRILRAIFNFAIIQYEDSQGNSLIIENPVKRLSQTRSWYRVKPRQTYIKTHELNAWYQAVLTLENQVIADYLQLVILTGLRRNEAAQLKWSDIDFKASTLTISDPKNHQDHILPITNHINDILQRRLQNKTNNYVFPGSGNADYLVEPRKQIDKVVAASKVLFTMHDLRRTFITIAESLDISAYALKRLLNHKMKNDVTSGYIITDVERLRKPMQQINDFVLARYLEIEVKNTNAGLA